MVSKVFMKIEKKIQTDARNTFSNTETVFFFYLQNNPVN